MTQEQYQKRLLQLLESAEKKFLSEIPSIEKNVYGRLILLIKDLEIRNGIILNSTENIRKIGQIRRAVQNAFIGKEYLKAVEEFIDVYDKIAAVQKKYFADNFEAIPNPAKLDELHKMAKEATVRHLTGSGIDADIIMEVEDLLRRNITSGGSFADMTTQLQEFMLGRGVVEHPGKLMNFANTIAADAINQFSAQYHQLISHDLGLEWFMYVGSNLETTREFCEHLTKKKYVHESELTQILKGEIAGKQVKINPKTKLWYGAIPGTNISNFQINRGGYRCRHKLIAVHKAVVPQHIRDLRK